MEPGTYETIKFKKHVLSFYWSGKFWYCNNKKDYRSNTGSGKSKIDAFDEYIQLNNL